MNGTDWTGTLILAGFVAAVALIGVVLGQLLERWRRGNRRW